MKFRDLKFGTKQMFGFGVILLIMAGINFYSIQKMESIKQEIDEISNNWMPRAIAISDINLNTSKLRILQLQQILASDKAAREEQWPLMIDLINIMATNIDTYDTLRADSERRNLYSEEEKRLYVDFDDKLDDYNALSLEFFLLMKQNQEEEAIKTLSFQAQSVFDSLSADLSELVTVNKQDAFDATHRANTTFSSTRAIIRLLLFFTIILSAVMAFVLIRLISHPLKKLVAAVKQVASGNLDVKSDIDSKDEIGTLASSFDQMTVALREAREKERLEAALKAEAAELRAKANEAEAKALKAENERKTKELEQARDMQLAMLPENLPELPGLEIAAYMKPATEVGGDYYDFNVEQDGTLTIAVGDATGHGLHAGLVVTAAKSLFNALSSITQPVKILKTASLALKGMGFRNMYMAMTLAKIKDRKMNLAAAGMPYTMVYHSDTGEVEEIILKGVPLGSFPDFSYQEKEYQLKENDAVLFMSDGITELFNAEKEMLGEERTKEIFAEAAGKSSSQIIDHFVSVVKDWSNNQPPDDDITFVALKVK